MTNHLTSENFPTHLIKDKTLNEKEFEYIDTKLIKGKSIVINKAGLLWLYMSDDHRQETPKQIIVKRLGHYELGFLPIERKKAIKLTTYKYI